MVPALTRRATEQGDKDAAEIFYRAPGPKLLASAALLVTTPPPALAVIDGTLSLLTREGTRALSHAPLATAVVEFRHGPLRVYVREHPYGLLPGIPNLYCLDADLRLQWMAEWPDPADPCARILNDDDGILVAESFRGALVRLDAFTGRLLGVTQPMATAV
jgi:hypothetical protein